MSESVIQVRDLSKRYRVGERERYLALRDVLAGAISLRRRPKRPIEYLWALRDINFDVSRGEVVGLIGRNGAGKTTLLKLLSRITRPTAGYAEVHGRVGSLLEVGTGFHPELTGRENIFLSGAILGMTRREIRAKHDTIVEFAGVERFLDTPLKHYSSGMQMRLAFAVAAHLEPEILLVDEVLAVGDLEFQRKCLGKMAEVSRSGRTIVFVSHQMGQVRRLCERVIWFDGGGIRQSGPTGDVVAAYESAALETEEASEGERRCFLRWSICGHGNVVRDGLREVVFHFHVRLQEPVSQGHFGFVIMTDASAVLAGWGFDDIAIPPGEQEITVRMPSLPLRPGVYTLGCSIYNGGNNLTCGKLIEQWYGLPPLIVDSTPLSHPQDRWAGVLNVPGSFEVVAK
ncbi:MAG TPA: polysaccharide ABC transporter ATP-binding protein [Candidatus Acidoferrum sp.]|nr:polysaccharide ABC transporter ATP-binding protein [Candidatus Acidoferrum sp.]